MISKVCDLSFLRSSALRASALSLTLFALSGCGDDESPSGDVGPEPGPPVSNPCHQPLEKDYSVRGAHSVGALRTEIQVSEVEEREVFLWYPAEASDAAPAIFTDFIQEDSRQRFEQQLTMTNVSCHVAETYSVLGATPTGEAGSYPLLVFSHCLGCVGPSTAAISAKLASHGFVVAAVTHTNTSWYSATGDAVGNLNNDELESRTQDVIATLDALLGDAELSDDANAIRQLINVDRVGVWGHSFGSITSANVVTQDAENARIGAWAGIHAPPSFLQGPDLSNFNIPSFMAIAEEDNSISALGNMMIETDWKKIPGDAILMSFADTGHFAITHMNGLGGNFMAGCGDGIRQTNKAPFTYLPPKTAMDELAISLTAFFDYALNGEKDGKQFMMCDAPASVQIRPAAQ